MLWSMDEKCTARLGQLQMEQQPSNKNMRACSQFLTLNAPIPSGCLNYLD